MSAFDFSTGWSYVIGGLTISFAAYSAVQRAVYVAYRNGTSTIVPNVPPPFPQWTYGNEAGLLALVANQ